MAKSSITAHLTSKTVSSRLYTSATRTHPFLVSAAKGTLSDKLLSYWLYQDRIYASQAYPRFIGSLISRIPFSTSLTLGEGKNTGEGGKNLSSSSPSSPQNILEILVFSLQNVVREVGFFDDTSRKWNLDLTPWRERKGTRDYTAEMARAGSGGLEEGLLFLWAMEEVYLDVWSTINDALKASSHHHESQGHGPLECLADNWSNAEFKTFVNNLARLVDNIYENLDERAWSAAEDVWLRVLELEEGFWPRAEEVEDDVAI